MKTLVIDIETSPNLAHVWSLWKQNVSLAQLQVRGQVISYAAKWVGGKKVFFQSDFHDGHAAMIEGAHALLDEADAVVHYNGSTFDVPHLNREFLLAGLSRPSPYRQIDLLKTVKKEFRFPSNKLDNILIELGLGRKVSHSGHKLWVDCLAGDEKAWALMKKYNVQDTRATEQVYEKLLEWISGHPNHALYDGREFACQRCGSQRLQKRGFAFTDMSKFQQYQCQDCKGWSRGTKRVGAVETRAL